MKRETHQELHHAATPLQLPLRSPSLNAYVERFMRSLESRTIWRMICCGETSLRLAVADYLAHYHTERNHQELDNELIEPSADMSNAPGEIKCHESSIEILCHSFGGATYRHYAHRDPLAFRAITTLPQPSAFTGLARGFDGECPCCRRAFEKAN